jgi:ubiquinone/menaquinone biosynthesis C-methylase UbiE
MKQNTLLAITEYYAPLPILRLAAGMEVADANIAADLLFPPAIRGTLTGALLAAFDRPASRGPRDATETAAAARAPVAPAEAAVEEREVDFGSEDFGPLGLRLTLLSLPERCSSGSLERTAYVQITSPSKESLFRRRLRFAVESHLVWETYALSYDQVLPRLDFYREVVERHSRAFSEMAQASILDLGAGTGNVTVRLLQQGHRVTAVDISRAMLDRLLGKLDTSTEAEVSVVRHDAADLAQWSNASFDGVNILLALFDMANPAAALAEAMRVLRPGGRLVVTEPRRSFDLSSLLSHAERCLREQGTHESLQEHCARVSRVNRKIDPSARRERLYVEDIRERLEHSGFSITGEKESHHGNCATVWAVRNPAGSGTVTGP